MKPIGKIDNCVGIFDRKFKIHERGKYTSYYAIICLIENPLIWPMYHILNDKGL